MTERRKDLRGFLWPTLCLVLPVLVLALLGLYLLRQDKFMVEREARERAREWSSRAAGWLPQAVLGQDLAAFTNYAAPWPMGKVFFQVNEQMQLVFPPQVTERGNELLADEMSPELRRLWDEAERLEFAANDLEAALKAWEQVTEMELPEGARALAEFNQAVLLQKLQQPEQAIGMLRELRHSPLSARTEAGFPVRHLAGIQLMRAFPEDQAAPLAKEIGVQLLQEPTTASPLLLKQGAEGLPRPAEIFRVYAQLWEQHEKARYLYHYAKGLMANAAAAHLANFHAADPANQWYGMVWNGTNAFAATGPVLASMLEEQQAKDNMPEYLEVRLSWDGNPLATTPLTVNRGELLAQSITDGLEAHVYLAKPEALFAMQRQRAFWIAGIIAFSALVAMVGVANNYRTHRKQTRLNEMKDNFVSSVSHELRAPLASMRLLSEGLQSGRVGGEAQQREYYDYLVQECRRLSLLVENVLDFSRIEQGRKEYDFQECDLGKIAQAAVRSVEPIAREHGVELVMEPAGAGELVAEVDGVAVQQALINLLDNAIKHSPEGVVVRVKLERDEECARIAVIDRGPGIDPAERVRIFERFYRLGSELRRETPGVGIGLSIVRHVAEAHGGKVHVDSDQGAGTVFTLDLPLQQRRGL